MSDLPLSFFVLFILRSCVRGNSETIYYSWCKLFGQSTLNTQSGLAGLPFLDLTSQKAHRIRKVLEGTCAAKAFYSCPAIISRRPESQKTPKEPQ